MKTNIYLFIECIKMKDKIILKVLKYLDTNDKNLKLEALEVLKKFAGHYRITLKKGAKSDLKLALYEFIDNGKGYNVTLVNLNNSLKY